MLDEYADDREFIENIRILDLACGSGSFLIGAYDRLLAYYAEVRQLDGPEHLSQEERINILKRHVFGVDLDSQAVEIARLNLVMRALKVRGKLPLLDNNIERGNSLLSDEGTSLEKIFGPDWRKKYPLNWDDRFPEIMERGGFDVVIGNPPYRKERESKELIEDIKKSPYGQQYYEGKMDYWYFFLHKAIDVVRQEGYIGFIVPSYWLMSTGASKLHKRLKREGQFLDVVDFGKNQVFQDVSGNHMTFAIQKSKNVLNVDYQKFDEEDLEADILATTVKNKDENFSTYSVLSNTDIWVEDGMIDFGRAPYQALDRKLKQTTDNLEGKENLFQVSQGLIEAPDVISRSTAEELGVPERTGEGVFVVSQSEINQYDFNAHERKFIKRYLHASDVSRYSYQFNNYFVFYIGNQDNKRIQSSPSNYPNIVKHFDDKHDFITSSNAPYGLHRSRKQKYFTSPKIIGPNMIDKPSFALCREEYYVNFAFNVIINGTAQYALEFLLGLLNSSFGEFWFNTHAKKRGVNVDVGVSTLRRFPICRIDLDDMRVKEMYADVINSVHILSEYYDSIRDLPQTEEYKELKREIESEEEKLDQLVYKLYDLTEEEIALVKRAID